VKFGTISNTTIAEYAVVRDVVRATYG